MPWSDIAVLMKLLKMDERLIPNKGKAIMLLFENGIGDVDGIWSQEEMREEEEGKEEEEEKGEENDKEVLHDKFEFMDKIISIPRTT